MGRPKKAEAGAVPTRARILQIAIELFAERGYDAVSIRDITRAAGLNEASLYNHFRNKADLLDAAFSQLTEGLLAPGLGPLPPEHFRMSDTQDLADFLLAGARDFFGRTDKSVMQTWRIILTSQYKHPSARDTMQNLMLDALRRFFTTMLRHFREEGRVGADVDCASYGRIIASIFFEFFFRLNLQAAWEPEKPMDFSSVSIDIATLAKHLIPIVH